MPRAMWKGAISFGLVTIPVSVYPATEEKTLRFNQLHDEDGGRIRMKRVCSIDGEEVGYEHIVKGYEYEKDRYVILTDEDFEAIPVESSRAIDIQQFVELEEIDPMQYKKSYYLVPEETGAKAYALLREALNRSGKVGIAKVSFRDKEHLAALRFRDEAFVLETMYWPDEIREADFGGRRRLGEDPAERAGDGPDADRQPHGRLGSRRVQGRVPRGHAPDRRGQDQRRGDRDRRGRAHGQGRRPDGGAEGLGRRRQEGAQGRAGPKKKPAKKTSAKKPAPRKKAVGE